MSDAVGHAANSSAWRCARRRDLAGGAAPIGQGKVRLAGPAQAHKVTALAPIGESVHSIPAGASSRCRQPADYARSRRRRRDAVGPDRPRGNGFGDDRNLSRMRRPRRAGRAIGAQWRAVRARPEEPAVDVARGAAARPRRQHRLPLQGGRSAPLPAVADRLIHRFLVFPLAVERGRP